MKRFLHRVCVRLLDLSYNLGGSLLCSVVLSFTIHGP